MIFWNKPEKCDVADQESVQIMFKEIRENYPRFDVLLNNAGVAADKAYRMADIPVESYRKIMSINLDGAWFVMQGIKWFMSLSKLFLFKFKSLIWVVLIR